MMTIVRALEGAQEREQAVAMALDELAREGARRMIVAALEIEGEEYRQQHRDAGAPNQNRDVKTCPLDFFALTHDSY